MMRALLYRDPLLRALPRLLLIAVPFALVFGQIGHLLALRGQAVPGATMPQEGPVQALLLFGIWTPLALLLLFGAAARGCHRMDLTLPIPARRLWLAHQQALWIVGVILLCAGAYVPVGFYHLLGFLLREDFPPLGMRMTPLLPRAFAGLALLIGVVQQWNRRIWRQRADRSYIVRALILYIGLYGLVLVLVNLHLAFTLLPMAAALVLGWRAYRSAPRVLDLVGEPGAARPAGDACAQEMGSGRKGLVHRVCWATAGGGGWAWLGGLVIAFFGFLAAGGAEVFFEWEDTRIMNIFMSSYVLLALSGVTTHRMISLDHLPLSRRVLFAYTVIPAALALLIGYGAGHIVVERAPAAGEKIFYVEEEGHYGLRVPLRFFKFTTAATAPGYIASSGEEHPAWSLPLFRGSSWKLYKPFTTPETSSRAYVGEQLSRAIEEIYGAHIRAEELSARYFTENDSGRVVLREGALTVGADYPHLRTRDFETFIAPLLLLLIGLFWLLPNALQLRTQRAGIGRGVQMGVRVTLLVLLIALNTLPIGLAMGNVADPHALQASLEIMARRIAETLPGGGVTLWGLSALLLVTAYLISQRQFENIEITKKSCYAKWPILEALRGEN